MDTRRPQLVPTLPQVLATTTDAATTRYVHNPLGGILSQHDAAGAWHWALVDGLGSVRGIVDEAFGVEGSRGFAPYGLPMDEAGSVTLPFAFTGEPRDGNGLQYHRARYYNPMVGVFPSLDALEVGNRYGYVGGNVVNDAVGEIMGLNRYSYVSGNPVNLIDPTGMIHEKLGQYDLVQVVVHPMNLTVPVVQYHINGNARVVWLCVPVPPQISRGGDERPHLV